MCNKSPAATAAHGLEGMLASKAGLQQKACIRPDADGPCAGPLQWPANWQCGCRQGVLHLQVVPVLLKLRRYSTFTDLGLAADGPAGVAWGRSRSTRNNSEELTGNCCVVPLCMHTPSADVDAMGRGWWLPFAVLLPCCCAEFLPSSRCGFTGCCWVCIWHRGCRAPAQAAAAPCRCGPYRSVGHSCC